RQPRGLVGRLCRVRRRDPHALPHNAGVADQYLPVLPERRRHCHRPGVARLSPAPSPDACHGSCGMSTSRKTLLALAAIALAQTAVLAWMVVSRIQLLRSGREIVLSVAPVDPRDLFRGEYVRLDYVAGRAALAPADGEPVKRGETLY